MRVSILAALLLCLLTCAAGAAGMYVYLSHQYEQRQIARHEPTNDLGPPDTGRVKGGELALDPVVKPATNHSDSPQPPKDVHNSHIDRSTTESAYPNESSTKSEPLPAKATEGRKLTGEEARVDEARKAAEDAKDEIEEISDLGELFDKRVDFSVSVSGRVSDSAGNPVAGAEVFADINERLGSETSVMMVSFSDSGEKVATTDNGGNFSGTVKGKVGEKAQVTLVMRAKAKGYAESKKVSIEAKSGDTKSDIRLSLQGAGSVRGRVVDASGTGVAGVTVSLSSQRGAGGLGEDIAVFGGPGKNSALSDASGTYQIEDVAEGSYTLNLRAPGYREKSGPRAVDVKADQVSQLDSDFVLAATTCLRAILVGADSKPLQGWATVEFTPTGGGAFQRLNAALNADGALVINEPPVGDFNVVVKLWGYFDSASTFCVFNQDQTTDMGTLTLTPNPEAGKGARRIRVGKSTK
jgi:Carboxypeptidase regulatory-like domain